MIYQRKDSPFWWYKFAVNGKTHQGSTKRADKKQATRYAASLYEEALSNAQYGIRPQITIGELMAMVVDQKEDRTRESYDYFRRKLLGLGSFEGSFCLDPLANMASLDKQDLLRLDSDRRKKQGLSVNTRNRELAFLRICVNKAEEWGFAVGDLGKIKLGKPKAKSRWLSTAEETALLAFLTLKGWQSSYDLAVFLLDTGARLNEALELRWTRVNLSSGIIYLWRFKGDRQTPIGITPRVRQVLERRVNYERPFPSMDDPVKKLREALNQTCNQDDEIVSTNGRATIHSLRDTFATRLRKKGMDLAGIRDLLGHKNITMTLKYAGADAEETATKGMELLS